MTIALSTGYWIRTHTERTLSVWNDRQTEQKASRERERARTWKAKERDKRWDLIRHATAAEAPVCTFVGGDFVWFAFFAATRSVPLVQWWSLSSYHTHTYIHTVAHSNTNSKAVNCIDICVFISHCVLSLVSANVHGHGCLCVSYNKVK